MTHYEVDTSLPLLGKGAYGGQHEIPAETASSGITDLFRPLLPKPILLFTQLLEKQAFSSELLRQHSLHTAFITAGIAARIDHLSVEELRQYAGAALVHDSGKSDASIFDLVKTGLPLGERDMAIVRMHPWKGYQMAQEFSVAPETAITILTHHRYWDGGGYPSPGEYNGFIPALAWVVAMADSVDASMDPGRRYKTPLPPSEMHTSIMNSMGTHFNPQYAHAFEIWYQSIVDSIHGGDLSRDGFMEAVREDALRTLEAV